MKLIDITGQRFGRLVAIDKSNIRRGTAPMWNAKCDCGRIVQHTGARLRSGHTKSCGCLRDDMAAARSRTHGGKGSKLYKIWQGMRKRCLQHRSINYKNYGGRGITICPEWSDFASFRDWALPLYRDGLQLDRIDVNGNYCPENCRFVMPHVNALNKRNTRRFSFLGEMLTISEAAAKYNIKRETLKERIHTHGLTPDEAVTRKVRAWNAHYS